MNEVIDEQDKQIAELSKKIGQYEAIFMKYRGALARTLDATCDNPSRMCVRCSKNTTCKGMFAHDALCGVLGSDIDVTKFF